MSDQENYDFYKSAMAGNADSGNTIVDNGEDNGTIWKDILANGADYLSGAANVIAAVKGNPIAGTAPVAVASTPQNNNTWIFIALGVVATIVVILVVVKMAK